MYRLIIAEKPSVAQSIAYCMGATERLKDGKSTYYRGNGYIVSNALGHLFCLGMPEDYGFSQWALESLPIVPEFKLFAIKGYEEQIKHLSRLMNSPEVSEIVVGTDAGREGELIFRYIYMAVKCQKPYKRLWISSLTEESIKNGMQNLLDGSEKDNLFLSGFTRAKADWLLGMSLSRLYSILNHDVHKVGRVKTPVLNIIAKRDLEIENFKKSTYYRAFLGNGAEYVQTFENQSQAESFVQSLQGKTAKVVQVDTKEKSENRPLLYSLTSLQQDANEFLGMTASNTLKTAQSLYEKRLITYPRTDSNYLSDDMVSTVESTVKCLSKHDSMRVDRLLKSGLNLDSRVIDNSKISDHHAIVPTTSIGKSLEMDLSQSERQTLDLIINRFLVSLDKPHRYVENKYKFNVDGNTFNLVCKKSVSLGWKEYSNKKTDTKPWFEYQKGDTFQVENTVAKECEKQPPKPFTEATLLSVMENIDRLVEDADLKKFVKERGLGTPATRSNIIEELISAGYVERSKKVLKSTEYGRKFVESLPELVKSAELTAQWEQSLNDIENGKTNADTILFEIQNTIDQTIEFEKARKQRNIVSRKPSVGKCPRCGGDVLENPKAFQCANLCGFTLWKQCKLIGRELSTAEVKNLLNGETTLKSCTSSKGKNYDANFKLEDTGKYINLKLVSFVKSR